jgi:choline dehydrogenase-like flavoprotein
VKEWDYVIVGGGTAGCVLASRLVEDPEVSVLLLEAGPVTPRRMSIPLVGMKFSKRYSWGYRTTPQPGLNGRSISFPYGKLLGGSSAINAMMYCRGSRGNYDEWASLGNEGWSYAEVLPWFEKFERQMQPSAPRHRARFSQAFVEACVQTGLSPATGFNVEEPRGAGYFEVLQRDGARSSSANTYLEPSVPNARLEVWTGVEVLRLALHDDRAFGVVHRNAKGEEEIARARREVLVCAGALNSPKLLMLSGVGPADHLRGLGIAVSIDLPGVGKNLRDHVRIPILYDASERSPGHRLDWPRAAVEYALFRSGVLTSNCCEAGAFIDGLQFVTHFQSHLLPGTVDLQCCLMRTRGTGSVTLSSDDPAAPPEIDPRYLSHSEEIDDLRRGLELARAVARAPALQGFGLGAERIPGSDCRTRTEIEYALRSSAETCYHAVGTCKMGSDPLAVVDAELRVHGVRGLRVVDASIMPTLPDGNTSAAVFMIAEKASAFLGSGHTLEAVSAGGVRL